MRGKLHPLVETKLNLLNLILKGLTMNANTTEVVADRNTVAQPNNDKSVRPSTPAPMGNNRPGEAAPAEAEKESN